MCGGGTGKRLDVRTSTIWWQRHAVMGDPTLIRSRMEIQFDRIPVEKKSCSCVVQIHTRTF